MYSGKGVTQKFLIYPTGGPGGKWGFEPPPRGPPRPASSHAADAEDFALALFVADEVAGVTC